MLRLGAQLESAGYRIVEIGPRAMETSGGLVEVAFLVEAPGDPDDLHDPRLVQIERQRQRQPVLLELLPVAGTRESELITTAISLRSRPEFGRSPVLIASPYPLPEKVRHYTGTSPAALFECEAALEADPGPAAAAGATLCRELVERHFGRRLDRSPESLVHLDRLATGFRVGEEPQFLVPTTFLFGAYLGEVLVANLDGRWDPRPGKEFLDQPLALAKGRMRCHPHRKALKLLSTSGADPEQTMTLFYERVEVRLAGRGRLGPSDGAGGRERFE